MVIQPDLQVRLYPFPEDMVLNRLHDVLRPDNNEIKEVIDYLLQSSGKLLRPRLVYLCSSFYPHDASEVCDCAAAVELIHLASLVHDDIIDHSDLRRGRESLNARWGEKISVLTGDYLFASAFSLISQTGLVEIMKEITNTIRIMCAGEIKQLNQTGDISLEQEEYFAKSFAKTGCLFACACKVGAMASEMPAEEAALLQKYGVCLGYAYQIIDDVLDFTADSRELGKPVGGDLLAGNITLPVLLALENERQGARIKNMLRDGNVDPRDLPRIIKVLEECGALKDSLRWAQAFVRQGLECLTALPAMDARLHLIELAHFLVHKYCSGQDIQRMQGMEA